MLRQFSSKTLHSSGHLRWLSGVTSTATTSDPTQSHRRFATQSPSQTTVPNTNQSSYQQPSKSQTNERPTQRPTKSDVRTNKNQTPQERQTRQTTPTTPAQSHSATTTPISTPNQPSSSTTTSSTTTSTSSTSSTTPLTPPSTPTPTVTPPLYLPAGTVLSSYTPPPYVPPTPQTRAARPGFFKTVARLTREYYQSAKHKLTHPIETVKDLVKPSGEKVHFDHHLAIKHQWRQFIERFGFKSQPVPPYKLAMSFSPQTDLSKFVLLNDNPFGGSSTCHMELKEYIELDPHTRAEKKRYTITFKGELHNMAPFQTSSSRWADDKARAAAPTKKEEELKEKKSQTKPPTGPTPMSSTPPSNRPTLASSLSSVPPAPSPSTATTATPTGASTNPRFPASSETAQSTTQPSPATPKPAPRSSGQINGFAAFISPLYQWPDLDLLRYDFLSMNIRTDGRPYIFNVRCREGITSAYGLVFQARVREETPRPMHKLEIRFTNLLSTQSGRMRSFPTPMPQDRIESFGFSVSGPPGPFELELEWIAGEVGIPEFERKQQQLKSQTAAHDRLTKIQKQKAVQAEMQRLRAEKGISEYKPQQPQWVQMLQDRIREGETNEKASQDTTTYPIEVQEDMRLEKVKHDRQVAEQMRMERDAISQADKVQKESNQPVPPSARLTPQQVMDILDETKGNDTKNKK